MREDNYRIHYFIDKNYKTDEQLHAALMHEMYHRVTLGRDGLHRDTWVDEIIAFLAAHYGLIEFGMTEYASYRLSYLTREQVLLSLEDVKHAKQKSFFEFSSSLFPEGYGGRIYRTAQELDLLVGWPQVRRMVDCRNWSDWLAPFSADIREKIILLLDLSVDV